MSARNLLFSAVHFFVVFFIFAIGALVLSLPYADPFRLFLLNGLLEPGRGFLYVGGGLVALAFALFVLLFTLNRRSYLQFEMKGSSVSVEEKVIRECALDYFKEIFPEENPYCEAQIKGKSMIELFVSLPKGEEKPFFEKVEKELGALFAEKLGYQAPFTLTFVET